MKFNLLKIFQRKRGDTSRLSKFLLHASEEEKRSVFTEAARKSNEDQRKIYKEANLKLETR